MTETKTETEKFLCTSTKANMTPAKGALNAALSPAAAPQVNNNFSSIFTR